MKPRREDENSNVGENVGNGRNYNHEPECKRMKPDVLLEMGLGVLEDFDDPCQKEIKDPKPLTSRNKLSPNDSTETKIYKESVERLHTFSSPFSDDFALFRRRKSQQSNGIDHFNKLSEEMVLMIFRWLPKRELTRCSLVCRRWRRVSCDEGLWTRLDLGNKTITLHNLAHVVQRGVRLLRLTSASIPAPILAENIFPSNYESKLQYLDLSMAVISVEGLALLLQHTRQLVKLSLEHCVLSAASCDAIGRNKCLEVLNMSMCYNLDAPGIKAIVKGCQRLQELNLAWTSLSLEAVDILSSRLTSSMLRLNLSGCRQTLLDRHLVELANQCPNLIELDVSDSATLTGACFDAIFCLQSLLQLGISRCYNVTGTNLLKLGELPSIVSVQMYGLVSESGLASLQGGLPETEINKHPFSKIARPTVGVRRTSIWGLRVRD